MLYSVFLILFGVYVGQEYPVVPSVKLVALSLLRYIKDNSEKVEDNTNLTGDQNMKNFLSNFIKSIYKKD
jgi:uncharacterized protein YqgC (DUF456 family)